jgi:lipid II:glycine glycyltransferase (peptidoglycan interpeptide bridge formation enzyme)
MLTISEISDESVWNEYILQLSPNTFLQTWEWGQMQREVGEAVRYAGIYDAQTLVGVALILTVHAKRGRHIFCPHGPLVADEALYPQALQAVVAYCRDAAGRDKALAIRIAPLLLNTPRHRQLFLAAGFRPAPMHVHTELTWMLDIASSEEQIVSGMRKTTRHAVMRAMKAGIEVATTNKPADVARFWTLYEATARRHKFTPFSRHFLSQQVTQFARHDRMFLVFASYQGEDLAAGIFMQVGNTVFYHHGASLGSTTKLPAAHAVQWAAIQEAKRRGATKYNFWGIAPEDQPKHPFAGITVFKKGFGGYAIDYMHAQDLPLNIGYSLLWTIEMWRKFRRGF